ncbi:MAG: hypothetical protein C4527_20220 [Candidatus Omnitrophota bacterium]|jgi:hypothetical protein|nr:MAG: hypothetical protein C4527_20220 [Candidatus Omnitrophota bacterium]
MPTCCNYSTFFSEKPSFPEGFSFSSSDLDCNLLVMEKKCKFNEANVEEMVKQDHLISIRNR